MAIPQKITGEEAITKVSAIVKAKIQEIAGEVSGKASLTENNTFSGNNDFSHTINLSNGTPLQFTALGTGTYNKGAFVCNAQDGIGFEAPMTTDSSSGNKLPITFSWRGGSASTGGFKVDGTGAYEKIGSNDWKKIATTDQIPTIPTIGNGTITIKQGSTTKGSFSVNQTGATTVTLDAVPTVNNGTVTINQGGTQKGSFTLNQSGNTTINLDAGGGGGGSTLYRHNIILTLSGSGLANINSLSFSYISSDATPISTFDDLLLEKDKFNISTARAATSDEVSISYIFGTFNVSGSNISFGFIDVYAVDYYGLINISSSKVTNVRDNIIEL